MLFRWMWVLLILLSFIMPVVLSVYYLNVLTELYIFGLFAMSANIILGYTGMITFGQAAYFGVGAYTSAFILLNTSVPLPLAVLFGAVSAGLIAVVIGYFSTRATSVYFAMLTLAFAQMIYAIAFKWYSFTGGSDGIAGIPRTNFGFGLIDFDSANTFYYFVLVVLIICVFLCNEILKSPFGKTLHAIRENERKVESLGINVRLFKLMAFVVGGLFAGVAGSLFSSYSGFASPEILFWSYSGTCLLMAVLGGLGTLFGPIVGAMLFILLEELIGAYTENYLTFVGIIFVLVVLFFPGGVVGYFSKFFKGRFAGKSERAGASEVAIGDEAS